MIVILLLVYCWDTWQQIKLYVKRLIKENVQILIAFSASKQYKLFLLTDVTQ